MNYVEEACSHCGLILPKNQLTHWVSEVQTGRVSAAVTTGTYANGKSRYTHKSGQRIFQTREEWLCPGCRDERQACAAAIARGRLIKWSLIALAVVALLAVARLSGGSASKSPSPPTSRASDHVTSSVGTPAVSNADVAPAPSTPVSSEERFAPPQPTLTPAPEQARGPAAAPNRPFLINGEDLTHNLAFRAAAREALETGEPVLWGERDGGEVSVGPLDETNSRPCRTLAYVVGRTRSTDIFMCRDAGGRWNPR